MLIFNYKNPKISQCFAKHHEDVVSCLAGFDIFLRTLFPVPTSIA